MKKNELYGSSDFFCIPEEALRKVNAIEKEKVVINV